jgi:putative endonuclease
MSRSWVRVPLEAQKFYLLSYWVYILYSESTDSFYKGQTKDLEERLIRHKNGYEKSTKRGAPWKLIWKTEKPDRSSSVKLELKLKNLSKEKLFNFMNKFSDGIVGPDVP